MSAETPRPSWFMMQGQPMCSIWGKSELEQLALATVTVLARTGDTWRALSAKECWDELEPEERSMAGPIGPHNRERYQDWWDQVSSHLVSADAAFEIGGLYWTRHLWEIEHEC